MKTIFKAFLFLSLIGPFGVAVTSASSHNLQRSKKSEHSFFTVDTGAKVLKISSKRYSEVENEYDWAKNFQAIDKTESTALNSIYTIYLLPMSGDRKLGTKIFRQEWLEIFQTTELGLVVVLRLNKGAYWVLSRTTIKAPPSIMAKVKRITRVPYKADPSKTLINTFIDFQDDPEVYAALQTEIDTIRYIMKNDF